MSRRSSGYSGLQIALHWVIAAIVLAQLVLGDAMEEAIERDADLSAADRLGAVAHYYLGIALLGLVIVRIIVRWASGAPPVLAQGWMRVAASASHGLFYVLLVLAPVSGLLAFYVGEPFDDVHELFKLAFIGLVSIHAMAALYHHFWLGDGTLRRMFVPGQ